MSCKFVRYVCMWIFLRQRLSIHVDLYKATLYGTCTSNILDYM